MKPVVLFAWINFATDINQDLMCLYWLKSSAHRTWCAMHMKLQTLHEVKEHKKGRRCVYKCMEPGCPKAPMNRERDIQTVVNICVKFCWTQYRPTSSSCFLNLCPLYSSHDQAKIQAFWTISGPFGTIFYTFPRLFLNCYFHHIAKKHAKMPKNV